MCRFAVLFCISVSVFSQPLLLDLTEEETAVFNSGEILYSAGGGQEDLRYLPAQFDEELNKFFEDYSPNLTIETCVNTGIESNTENFQHIYNILRQISALTGAQYFSNKKGDFHPIFHRSYRIESFDSPIPINDAEYEIPPRYDEDYILQEPSSLLEMRSKIEYLVKDNTIFSVSRNLDEVRFNFMTWVKVAAPENMRTMIIVYPDRGRFVFYSLLTARVTMIPGVGAKAKEAFKNRSEGLAVWYLDQFLSISDSGDS